MLVAVTRVNQKIIETNGSLNVEPKGLMALYPGPQVGPLVLPRWPP